VKRQRDALAAQRQREIWRALVEFIHRRGGFLVSTPGEKDLRIEAPQFSEVFDELGRLGFRLAPAGTGERIIADRITPVLVYTFQIPLPR
jgi:hypothetical protein